MPPQKKSGSLFGKYADKVASVAANREGKDVDYGRQELPAGIKKGIAQLVKVGFGKFAPGTKLAGETFFRAEGRVVEPRSLTLPDGREVPVEGGITSVILPACDTTRKDRETGKDVVVTFEENFDRILNEMDKLAGAGFTSGGEPETLAESLQETTNGDEPIYFWFDTTQSAPSEAYPDPRVFHNWNGNRGLEKYSPPSDDGVTDNTKVVKSGPAKPSPTKTQPAPEPTADEPSLDDLVAAATADDSEAQQKLSALAAKLGVGQDADDAKDWEEVKGIIEAAQEAASKKPAGKSVKTPAKDETTTVKVEGVYQFSPIDKKTGKPFVDGKTKKPRKPLDVEVTAVNAKKKTASVKDTGDDSKTWDDVPFDQLHSPY